MWVIFHHAKTQCCGSGMFIADPTFSIPDPNFPSRIRIKEFKHFNPKKWFLSSRKYGPGCSSRIPDPDPYFLPIPDPGVKKAPDTVFGSATLKRPVSGFVDHNNLNLSRWVGDGQSPAHSLQPQLPHSGGRAKAGTLCLSLLLSWKLFSGHVPTVCAAHILVVTKSRIALVVRWGNRQLILTAFCKKQLFDSLFVFRVWFLCCVRYAKKLLTFFRFLGAIFADFSSDLILRPLLNYPGLVTVHFLPLRQVA